ncbi:hypothetical protein, partial [Cryptosporangium minutisporangium]|uniref:hypothetical protein n=1 Tax=Cryptosporangium minutisporangium TaxID=113569 RepID=UPI0035F0F323
MLRCPRSPGVPTADSSNRGTGHRTVPGGRGTQRSGSAAVVGSTSGSRSAHLAPVSIGASGGTERINCVPASDRATDIGGGITGTSSRVPASRPDLAS